MQEVKKRPTARRANWEQAGECHCPCPPRGQLDLKATDSFLPEPRQLCTLLLHHFSWALLKDGVGLDHFWAPPAPSMALSLSVSIPFTLFLLDCYFFLGLFLDLPTDDIWGEGFLLDSSEGEVPGADGGKAAWSEGRRRPPPDKPPGTGQEGSGPSWSAGIAGGVSFRHVAWAAAPHLARPDFTSNAIRSPP